MLKNWHKVIIAVSFSFLLCFFSIGYAQVTDILDIQGVSNIEPKIGVFITDTSVADGVTVKGFTDCVLSSTTDLNGRTEATVNVTVYNNSSVVYGYNVMKYVVDEGSYDNDQISVSTKMEKKHPDWTVQPNGYLTFPVTFTFIKGANTQNTVLNSVIEFEFLPYDEIPVEDDETTVNNAMDRFEEILNTPEEHELLDNYMDNIPSNDRNSTYISNVPGANSTDIASIESLFVGNLHININGVQTDVKIMIKEENITNSYQGNEMVIYMTTDPLDTRWATAIVYRCVFVNDNGVWKRMNDITQGKANVCDYSSGMRWGTGSFNTDSWKAS